MTKLVGFQFITFDNGMLNAVGPVVKTYNEALMRQHQRASGTIFRIEESENGELRMFAVKGGEP